MTNKENEGEKQEYHVEVKRSGHGFVKVLARSKDEAEKVVKGMTVKRLLNYYKEKYEFVSTGEATLPDDD
jgi:hypothetical protein